MCVTSVGIIPPSRETAEKDIVTWKIVKTCKRRKFLGIPVGRRRLESFHRGFLYIPGRTYTTELDQFKEKRYGYGWISSRGFYSWGTQPSVFELDTYQCIIKCIIPRGSEYYLLGDVYISDHIRII